MPDKSLPTLVTELWDLVRAYAKQETVEPLKGIGRWLAYGVAGSLFLGAGLVLLGVGGLRALQTETGTTFQESWSWAPYLITLAGLAILIALAVKVGMKKRTKP